MIQYTRTLTANGTSAACRLDHFQTPFNVLIEVDITGTATAKVQYSLSDPIMSTDAIGTGMVWQDHSTLVSLTTAAVGNMAFPVQAARLVVSGVAATPTVTMTLIQAGI
jgi:hypothetical protein